MLRNKLFHHILNRKEQKVNILLAVLGLIQRINLHNKDRYRAPAVDPGSITELLHLLFDVLLAHMSLQQADQEEVSGLLQITEGLLLKPGFGGEQVLERIADHVEFIVLGGHDKIAGGLAHQLLDGRIHSSGEKPGQRHEHSHKADHGGDGDVADFDRFLGQTVDGYYGDIHPIVHIRP
ncbi:hypothetical protein D3C75_736880 [compost metagenome]